MSEEPAAGAGGDTDGSATPAKPTGGRLLAAISTQIVALLSEHYGRGPMKAKTYALDDIIVIVMRDSGYSPIEKTMMDSGEPEAVVAMREDFQRLMAQRYTAQCSGPCHQPQGSFAWVGQTGKRSMVFS